MSPTAGERDEKQGAVRRVEPGLLVSVVVPCFNEEPVLPLLFERLQSCAGGWQSDYEVLLVDDGSRDGTWELMRSFARRDPRWKAIRLARNFGHQVALWTGLQRVSGRVAAVLDADLQDSPELLRQFLARWEEGYDVVYAVRVQRKEGLVKRAAYHLFYRVLSFLSEIDVPLDSGDFCVLDRRVLEAMKLARDREPFIRGLRAWVGFRQLGVACERDRRAAGSSKYTFGRLINLAVSGIFSLSSRPLKLASYLGLVVSTVSFLGAVFTLFQRVFAEQFAKIGLWPVPGFATTVIAILFVGGVQLVCLGILGEYVGRIYENVKGWPQATVMETEGLPEA